MSDLINSTNMNINSEIAAKKLSKNDERPAFIEAPKSLPKYSINGVLQEKDDFRKNIIMQQNPDLFSEKKKSILPKIGVMVAAAAGFLIFKKKK